jgi:exosortase family protein XrtF
MQFVNTYINRWKNIPAEVRSILIKGFAFLVIWKLLYAFWLAPSRLLDKPLTTLVANQSAWVMNLFSVNKPYTVGTTLKKRNDDNTNYTEYGTILYNNKPTINIADPCNGLEFLLLYAWFILVMPGTVKRRILFLTGGLLLLHISNLFRCWGLVEIYRQYRHSFDFAHHYLFKIIIYGLSFLLWYWYLKALKQSPRQANEN